MGSNIITTITSAIANMVTSLASGLLSGFNTLFVDTSGSTPVLTNFAIFMLTFLGVGFAIAIVGFLRGLAKSRS